jgi:hypothetical protein
MISESLSTSMIARALAISPSTVQAVRLRENISVEVERSRLLDLVRGASRLCVERLTELIPSMSARDAAISAGILIEKQQLLSGEATFISAAKHEQLSHVDFNTLLELNTTGFVMCAPATTLWSQRHKQTSLFHCAPQYRWRPRKVDRFHRCGTTLQKLF